MNTWKHDIMMPEITGDDKSYIRLRQPTNAEWKIIFRIQKSLPKLEEDSDTACDALASFCELLRTLIIDHNIEDSGRKLSSKEVADFINGDLMLTIKVLRDYFQALPLTKASSMKSGS